MSGSVVDIDGRIRQLDAKAGPTHVLTAEDVQDPDKLARALNELRAEQDAFRRRHEPRWREWEDVTVGTGAYSFEHGFRGRVRWWVVDWLPDSPADMPVLERSSDSTPDTLVLDSACAGVLTLRVEEVP